MTDTQILFVGECINLGVFYTPDHWDTETHNLYTIIFTPFKRSIEMARLWLLRRTEINRDRLAKANCHLGCHHTHVVRGLNIFRRRVVRAKERYLSAFGEPRREAVERIRASDPARVEPPIAMAPEYPGSISCVSATRRHPNRTGAGRFSRHAVRKDSTRPYYLYWRAGRQLHSAAPREAVSFRAHDLHRCRSASR